MVSIFDSRYIRSQLIEGRESNDASAEDSDAYLPRVMQNCTLVHSEFTFSIGGGRCVRQFKGISPPERVD
jgi:hypothetical protein